MNVILGVTGSVAGILTPKMAGALIDAGHEVRIVATTPGLYFLPEGTKDDLEVPTSEGTAKVQVFRDKDEWPESGYHKKDPVQHIDFREWGDILLIAPLTANTLAKIANGICDNFLCCIARAWVKTKPMVLAPAMNTEMWEDPIISEHLKSLPNRFKKHGIVYPVKGNLACGGVGIGPMAPIKDIVSMVNYLKKS